MFVKTSQQLTDAITCILEIYNRLVIGMDSLELESVRSIANRTDNVPHLLIGVDKFIHLKDDIGSEHVPFPDWYNCLFPSLDSISDHLWLLTVERQYDATHAGFMVWQEMSTSKLVLVARRATMPETTTPTTSNVGTSYAMSVKKGKKKVMSGELGAAEKEVDGESEVGEKDIEMAEDLSEPVWGRSKKRARSHSKSWPQSRWRSQSQAMQRGMKGVEGHGEGTPAPSNPPPSPKPKYGRAQLATRTTPPPDPEACGMCINCKVEKDTGLSRWPGLSEQSSSFIIVSPTTVNYQINDVERQVAWYEGHTSAILQDHMQVLEQELANCQLDVTTLTHEMEMLRASVHGAQPAQTTGIASADEDLLNLFGLSNNNTPMDEAKESIAMELHGLVLMATPSTHDISTNQPIQEGSMMGTPVEEESALVVAETQSGVMSTQNDEEGAALVEYPWLNCAISWIPCGETNPQLVRVPISDLLGLNDMGSRSWYDVSGDLMPGNPMILPPNVWDNDEESCGSHMQCGLTTVYIDLMPGNPVILLPNVWDNDEESRGSHMKCGPMTGE
ncbi:hypothetical protein EDC04DRAFT_2610616 [Pisolithus marmoratus]|nr:hypothetical protein EDC04DRAFT_2610616 [Pisolithus marmoratus]